MKLKSYSFRNAFLACLACVGLATSAFSCGGDDEAESQSKLSTGGSGGQADGGGGSAGDVDGGGGTGATAGTGATGGTGGDAGQTDGPPIPPDTHALLEIYPMDLWSQFLPPNATLDVTVGGQPLTMGGSPVVIVPLTEAASIKVHLALSEHRELEVVVDYDGSDALSGASVLAGVDATGQGVVMSHDQRTVEAKSMPVHSLYLGLRHLWFSAQGRPARRGNDLTFLMDGEEAWGSVYDDLQTSTKSVLVSTWWWESDFELVRGLNSHLLDPSARWENTILGVLESRPADKRVLVGQFWGQDSILGWMTTDAELKAYAEAPNDGFEFMGMANETEGKFFFEPSTFKFGERVKASVADAANRTFDAEADIESNLPARAVDLTEWPVGVEAQHASYHQKFMVVDNQVAYVGGMNFRRVDWDTNDHLVFDHRRMLFDATQTEREAVMNKDELPDNGPRKDYMVRIHGPSAQDVADVFHIRWAHQLAAGVNYAAESTDFTVDRNIASQPNGVQAQVTATLPQPFWEHAIGETWFNAVAMAQDYIYIEDQYFRVPMLNDVIMQRMQQVPNLKLIVITKPVSEWTDPGCAWTHQSHELFKNAFPTRYMMLQLRAFDYVDVGWGFDETESRYADMDVHSKMLIVDDKFMSVGSCNKNNRGIVYEGELNTAVLDPDWVRSARRRIFANILPAGTTATDNVNTWWEQFATAAAWNDQVYASWEAEGFDISLDGAPLPAEYTPDGFVHTLEFGSLDDCLMESVGPDMVGRDD